MDNKMWILHSNHALALKIEKETEKFIWKNYLKNCFAFRMEWVSVLRQEARSDQGASKSVNPTQGRLLRLNSLSFPPLPPSIKKDTCTQYSTHKT